MMVNLISVLSVTALAAPAFARIDIIAAVSQ